MPGTITALTSEEIATARTAIRVFRTVSAIGVAVAIPVLLVLALPLLSYALVAGLLFGPILVGAALLWAVRQDVRQTS